MNEAYSPDLEGVIAGETAINTVETELTYHNYGIEDLADLLADTEQALAKI